MCRRRLLTIFTLNFDLLKKDAEIGKGEQDWNVANANRGFSYIKRIHSQLHEMHCGIGQVDYKVRLVLLHINQYYCLARFLALFVMVQVSQFYAVFLSLNAFHFKIN